MVSQRTYAWRLPKRFRTKINFFRTLQKRFYIESFITNFFNISRKIPYFLCSYYSLSTLWIPSPPVALSIPLTSCTILIPSLSLLVVLLLPSLLCVFPVLSLFLFTVSVSYHSCLLLPPITSLTLLLLCLSLSEGAVKEVEGVKGVMGAQGDRNDRKRIQ